MLAAAAEIAARSPLAQSADKRILERLREAGRALDPALEAELEALHNACFQTPEFREGIAAFNEHREPRTGDERDVVERFDYVVVGAGTAGCVVAGRLSENPDVRVLVVEAGSAERTRAMTVPHAWPENFGSAADWGEFTTPQAGAGPVAYTARPSLGRVRLRSTRWRTCAGIARSTTAGPRTGRPAGGSRTCCRTSGASNGRTAVTRRCAVPTDRSRSARRRRRTRWHVRSCRR